MERKTYTVDREDKHIVAGVGHGQKMAGKKDDVDESESGRAEETVSQVVLCTQARQPIIVWRTKRL